MFYVVFILDDPFIFLNIRVRLITWDVLKNSVILFQHQASSLVAEAPCRAPCSQAGSLEPGGCEWEVSCGSTVAMRRLCRRRGAFRSTAVLGRVPFGVSFSLCFLGRPQGPCVEVERELFLSMSPIGRHWTNHHGDDSKTPSVCVLFSLKICISAARLFPQKEQFFSLQQTSFITVFSCDHSAFFSTSVQFLPDTLVFCLAPLWFILFP